MSTGGEEDRISEIKILATEKRTEGGKHYIYWILVRYASGREVNVWRRYSQFDALRSTMADILGANVRLPKLTSKKYLVRSSVHQVATQRMPKLERFLGELLLQHTNMAAYRTLLFWLTPTAIDEARATHEVPRPEEQDESEDGDASDGEYDAEGLLDGSRSVDNDGGGMGPVRPPTGPGGMTVRVLWDFEPRDGEELALREGDVIHNVKSTSAEWMEGELGGRVGPFPANYVVTIPESPMGPRKTNATTLDSVVAQRKPSGPLDELRLTEEAYVRELINVRNTFFPKLRVLLNAHQARILFNNWVELIPCSQVGSRVPARLCFD